MLALCEDNVRVGGAPRGVGFDLLASTCVFQIKRVFFYEYEFLFLCWLSHVVVLDKRNANRTSCF